MGLDMYLNRKIYYGGNYKRKGQHNAPHDMEISGDFVKKNKIDIDKITYIEEKTITWRKANAIHWWFVNNVQGGNDDCKDYYVSIDDLKNLSNICTEVIKSSKLVKGKVQNGTSFEKGKAEPILEDGKYIEDATIAKRLLPAREGFFFGSTDYDQWYLDDIIYTQKMLKEIILSNDGGDYYYNSSW